MRTVLTIAIVLWLWAGNLATYFYYMTDREVNKMTEKSIKRPYPRIYYHILGMSFLILIGGFVSLMILILTKKEDR